jgi:hypothetical protein
VNAQDYTWFNGTTLDYGYCQTLAQDMSPSEAIHRMDGEPHELLDSADYLCAKAPLRR